MTCCDQSECSIRHQSFAGKTPELWKMLRRLNWSRVYFIHTSLTRLATFIVSAEVGRSLRQGEDGAFGDSHFHSSSSLRVNDCVAPSFFLPFIFLSFHFSFADRQAHPQRRRKSIYILTFFSGQKNAPAYSHGLTFHLCQNHQCVV